MDAELEEALRRGGVVWVGLDGRAPRPVWHVWHDAAVHVVCGGGEQELPGAAGAAQAVVVARGRGSLAGRAGELAADVERLAPGTPAWDEVVPLLVAARLNAPDLDALPEQWARSSVVLRLRSAP
ncbi:MAG TPA: hypothetical protein VNU66_11175 [Mycobacteriales bacterium]|nr:hypothetical protein [Mycobacteriales bacterium]